MRVALILTGEIRTLDKIHHLIYEKIIAPFNADIFIHADESNFRSSIQVNKNIFRSYWGDFIKDYAFTTEEEKKEYAKILDIVWTCKPGCAPHVVARSGVNREYIRNSGTVIEYYHVWKAACMMFKYENKNDFKYDYVIRSRFDTILTQTPKLEEITEGTVKTFRENVVWILCRKDASKVLPIIYFFGDYDNGNKNCWNSEMQFQLHLKYFGLIQDNIYSKEDEKYLSTPSLNRNIIKDGKINPDLPSSVNIVVIRGENYPYWR